MKCPQNAFYQYFSLWILWLHMGLSENTVKLLAAGQWSAAPLNILNCRSMGSMGIFFRCTHIGYLTIADYLDSTEGCKDTHWARWHGEERLVRRLGRHPGHPVGEFLWKFDGAAILIYSNGVHHHFSHENWLFGHILIHFFNIFSHSHGVGVGSVKPCHAHATWVLL